MPSCVEPWKRRGKHKIIRKHKWLKEKPELRMRSTSYCRASASLSLVTSSTLGFHCPILFFNQWRRWRRQHIDREFFWTIASFSLFSLCWDSPDREKGGRNQHSCLFFLLILPPILLISPICLCLCMSASFCTLFLHYLMLMKSISPVHASAPFSLSCPLQLVDDNITEVLGGVLGTYQLRFRSVSSIFYPFRASYPHPPHFR